MKGFNYFIFINCLVEKTKNFLPSFLLIFCLFILFSCTNVFTSSDDSSVMQKNAGNGTVTVSGTIKMNGAMPEAISQTSSVVENARSAIPSLNTSDYCYFVKAESQVGSETISINSIDNSSDFLTDVSGTAFALRLPYGKWTITAGIKKVTSSTVTDITLMEDSFPANLTLSETVINHSFFPVPLTEGAGTLELGIIPFGPGYYKTSCSNPNWNADDIETYSAGASQTLRTKEGKFIPSGSYDVTINVYDSNDVLIYSTSQIINIFDNMKTNKWCDDGSGIINSSGFFKLTDELKNKFARTTFYVGQTEAATSALNTASDTSGTGSPYAPFATIQKALEVVKSCNDGSSNYKIYLCSDQNMSGLYQSISVIPDDKAIKLTIQSYLTDSNTKYTFDGTGTSFNGTFFKIEGKSKTESFVTLKNIVIKGHIYNLYGSGSTGGGLLCTKANVTLDGCKIIGNKCYAQGGGIYAGSSSKLTLKNTLISENSATGESYASGGGLALNDGAEVYIETGTRITENSSALNGGGISIIGNTTSLTMKGGEISDNSADFNGGGIYSGEYATGSIITGGEISGNTAGVSGGAMFLVTGANIGGSAWIPYGGSYKNNDIALYKTETSAAYAKITVTQTLTPPDEANGITATFVPVDLESDSIVPVYENSRPVLQAGSGVTLLNEIKHFAVTSETKEDGSSVQWYISSTGKLYDKMDAAFFTVDDYDSVSELIVVSTDGLKNIAELTNASSNSKDFSGKTITLLENVSIGETFPLIGTSTAKFKGTFDGNNKTLTVTNTSLFLSLGSGSTVKNLILSGTTNKGAPLAYESVYGTVEYCTSNVKITNGRAGGFVYEVGAGGIVRYCVNNGEINVSSSYAGGIAVSVSGGTIDRCINQGKITGDNTYVGGISGRIRTNGTISNCKNTGIITSSSSRAAGIVGAASSDSAGIKNCGTTGTISSSTPADLSDIVGIWESGSDNKGHVENCCDKDFYHKTNNKSEGIYFNHPVDGSAMKLNLSLSALNSWALANNGISWKKLNDTTIELNLSW